MFKSFYLFCFVKNRDLLSEWATLIWLRNNGNVPTMYLKKRKFGILSCFMGSWLRFWFSDSDKRKPLCSWCDLVPHIRLASNENDGRGRGVTPDLWTPEIEGRKERGRIWNFVTKQEDVGPLVDQWQLPRGRRLKVGRPAWRQRQRRGGSMVRNVSLMSGSWCRSSNSYSSAI